MKIFVRKRFLEKHKILGKSYELTKKKAIKKKKEKKKKGKGKGKGKQLLEINIQ